MYLESDNFCTELNSDVNLEGNLKIYNSAQRRTENYNFYNDEIAYFRAVLTSDATIQSVDLKKIAYTPPGNSSATIIYDRDATTSVLAGFIILSEQSPNAAFADFNIKIDSVNFPIVNVVSSYRVDATIEATYTDATKRFLEVSYSTNQNVGKIGQVASRIRFTISKPQPVFESSTEAAIISSIGKSQPVLESSNEGVIFSSSMPHELNSATKSFSSITITFISFIFVLFCTFMF